MRNFRRYFKYLAVMQACVVGIMVLMLVLVWLVTGGVPEWEDVLVVMMVMMGIAAGYSTYRLLTEWTYRDEDFED